MSPTRSIISDYASEHPFSHSDHMNLFDDDVTCYKKSIITSDETSQHSPLSPTGTYASDSKCSSVPPTTHTFSLPAAANDLPLMTVILHSWASSSANTPSFFEGQCISGQVQLNLRSPDRVKAVSVSVEGYCSIPGYEAKDFLELSETLWDCNMGDPRSSSVFLPESADRTDRLHGKYSWSFKLDFPKTVGIPGKDAKRALINGPLVERLPPSLRGSHGHARIGYELVARVKRPGLRFGSSLTVPISYMTSTRPSSEVLLRRLTCHNSTLPIPSLFDDPTGWEVFPEFQVLGSFKSSPVSVTCAFALASPLSYARGSFISCAMVASSFDQRILDALSSPSAPRALLRRRLVLYSKLGSELVLDGQEKIISRATWIPSYSSGSRRIIQGEISIPPSTLPSFAFGRLELKYDVLVCPFDVPGYSQTDFGPLLRADVMVATLPDERPVPISQITSNSRV